MNLDALAEKLCKELELKPFPEDRAAIRAALAQVRAEALEEADKRWNLMFGCARVSAVGSAGLGENSDGNYAHLCLNFWTMHEPATGIEPLAKEWIDKFMEKSAAIRSLEVKP